MSCYHYRIIGRVQGVFFRAYTCEQANSIGLQGWVRNLPDGSVETVACGNEQQLAEFEIYLNEGAPLASVSRVDVEKYPQTPEITGFIIR